MLFAAYAPLVVAVGTRFPFALWAFMRQQRAEMQEQATRLGSVVKGETKGELSVPRGDIITIVLTLPETVFALDKGSEPVRRIVWTGSVQKAQFTIFVREDAPIGRHLCSAVLLCGVSAATLEFAIVVSEYRDVMRAAAVAAASAAAKGSSTDAGLQAGGVGERGARSVEGVGHGPSTQLNILETRFESLPVTCPLLHMEDIEVEKVRPKRCVCTKARAALDFLSSRRPTYPLSLAYAL